MDTKRLAERLKRKFMTSDPFEIAASIGAVVLFEPLGDIRGYYNLSYRTRFIHINSDLSERDRRFVCAHELAHVFMHPKTNATFLLTSTNFALGRLENEANRFAVDLIFDDADLVPYLGVSIENAACALGLPQDLALYRLSSVKW